MLFLLKGGKMPERVFWWLSCPKCEWLGDIEVASANSCPLCSQKGITFNKGTKEEYLQMKSDRDLVGDSNG